MAVKDEAGNNWIFLMPDECVKNITHANIKQENEKSVDGTPLTIITLMHPCSEDPVKFIFDENAGCLYEINSHKDKHGSWFVDNNVHQNGSLFLATIFDPLYCLLPYLRNSGQAEKFVLLDQLLKDDKFPDCHKLIKCVSQEQLKNVAEVSGSGDYTGFKYNQDKTLAWLSKKVKKTVEAVSSAAMFIPPDEEDKENEDELRLEYAFRFIASYLDEEMSNLLQKHLKIRKRAEKRHSIDHGNSLKAKRIKTEAVNQGKSSKPTKMSKAQRDLSKVNKKGMKNISSFFSPKSKK